MLPPLGDIEAKRLLKWRATPCGHSGECSPDTTFGANKTETLIKQAISDHRKRFPDCGTDIIHVMEEWRPVFPAA